MKITVEIQKEGKWYVAQCPSIPEANGQGLTEEESIQSLKEAIELLMEDTLADAQKNNVSCRQLELV